MRIILLGLIWVGVALAQTGTLICNPTATSGQPGYCPPGASMPHARGYNWRLPYDSVNHEFLYFGGGASDPTIYSSGIWGYSPVSHTWTLRADNGNSSSDEPTVCADATLNPQQGHPLGYMAFDSGRNKWYSTLQLCANYSQGKTSSYNATSRSMDSLSATGPYGCTGRNCSIGWNDGMEYVSGYGKTVACCAATSGSGFGMAEFDGTTWSDLTSSVTGTKPTALNGAGMVSDGTYLWVFGGCVGTTPGNGNNADSCQNNSGTPSAELYKYNPATKAMSLISPAGGTKPATGWTNFPMLAYDSRRARLVFYDPGNKVLWQYVIASNTWSQVTYSGVLPDQSNWDSTQAAIIAMGTANSAGYDPVTDTMVMTYSLGQTYAPGVYELNFGGGNVSTTLTVQEANHWGFTGADRTSEPFTVGVAFPDSAGLTDTNTLTLTGATAGQFTTIGNWPSGNIKWVKTSGIASLSSGGTATVTVSNGGSGNFGGSNLATDNGTTISVATGTATFTVKKANFNGLDVVDVGSTHVVLTGASKGFVLYGPDPTATYPANVTCSPTTGGTDCSVATGTPYTSANDDSSTVTILENGPVMAVLKATWTYKDAAKTHSYMNGTAYLYFYKGKAYAHIVPVLRNADYGTGAVAATAYKGIQGYEFQAGLNISSGNVTVANHTATPTTSTVGAGESVVLYQGESSLHKAEEVATAWTTVQGYTIKKGATTLTSGTAAQSPEGWADIESSGAGVEIGQFWLGSEGSKSLEFAQSGSNITAKVGILAPQNTQPYYIEYPAWVLEGPRGIWLNFHAAAPTTQSADFQKWQNFLIARQPVADYNAAGVFEYPIQEAAMQDAYESANYTGAVPATIPSGNRWADGSGTKGTPTDCPGTYACPSVTRRFSWQLESDYRYDYLMTWLQRGWAARYLEALSFYNFVGEYGAPHSDGFHWYDYWDSSFTQLDGFGQPKVTVNGNNANASRGIHIAGVAGYTNWHDQEHNHWWGMPSYYFLSGDPFIKDALINQQKNWYLATKVYQDGGSPGSKTVNLTAGNSTVVRNDGLNWTATVIGQTLLVGIAPNLTTYKVLSLTDGTHAVVTPTPASTLASQPMIYGGTLYNSRAFASGTLGGVAFARFLQDIGDSDYAQVQTQLKHSYDIHVKADLCGSGFPAGCSMGSLETPAQISGVNPKRGFIWGSQGTSGNWCATPHTYRVNSAFQSALAIQGILALRNLLGPTWSNYWESLDRAYGIAQFSQSELYIDDGTGHWNTNGFRFGVAFDARNDCQAAGDIYTVSTNGTTTVTNVGANSFANMCTNKTPPCVKNGALEPMLSVTPDIHPLSTIDGTQNEIVSVQSASSLTVANAAPAKASQTLVTGEIDFATPTNTYDYPFVFYADWLATGSTAWSRKLAQTMAMMQGVSGKGSRNFMGHEWALPVHIVQNPGTKTLQNLTISTFTDHGDGSYTLGWTTPAGTDYLRVKWAPSQIVDWIGFDPNTNAFTGDSANTAWFAANNASGIPTPSAGAQTMTVTTGVSGMAANQFSVKAMAPAGAPAPSPVRVVSNSSRTIRNSVH